MVFLPAIARILLSSYRNDMSDMGIQILTGVVSFTICLRLISKQEKNKDTKLQHEKIKNFSTNQTRKRSKIQNIIFYFSFFFIIKAKTIL